MDVIEGLKMTKKERDELNKLRMAEFMTEDEDDMRKAYRTAKGQLDMLQEEMGLTRYEAIAFLATMLGNAIRQ